MEERGKAQITRMEKRLRTWFGRLDAARRRHVAVWSRALRPTTEQWLENRRQWQDRVVDALRVRDDPGSSPPASRSSAHRSPPSTA